MKIISITPQANKPYITKAAINVKDHKIGGDPFAVIHAIPMLEDETMVAPEMDFKLEGAEYDAWQNSESYLETWMKPQIELGINPPPVEEEEEE